MRLQLVALAAGTLTGALWGGDMGQEHVTVRVFDHAGVPEATLRKASLTAQAIFKSVRIETEWLTCFASGREEVCAPPALNGKVVDGDLMIIVHHRPFSRLPQPCAFGIALRESRSRTGDTAYVFYDLVEKAATGTLHAEGQLLAVVMAHETAHLLGLAHSSGGMMSASWTKLELMKAYAG